MLFLPIKEIHYKKKIKQLFSKSSENRWKFSSDQEIILLFKQNTNVYRNKMCKTWPKELENGGIRAINRGFPFLLTVSTCLSDLTINKS